MLLELDCSCCQGHFPADPLSPAGALLDRMSEEGPWSALGDGETFEDAIFTALSAGEAICCPECGQPVSFDEDNLGRVAMAMLTCW